MRADVAEALCALGRVSDLSRLGEGGPLLASAGTESWFNCLFARDAVWMAFDLLEDFPAVARATLLELAALQGLDTDLRADEEPGRVLHQHHPQPGADHQWRFPYYGAIDTTPLWITLLHAYCRTCTSGFLSTPLRDRARAPITLHTALERAVGWLVARLDGPVPGYLAARRMLPSSMINQSWMDSFDSLYFADGTLFDPDLWRVPVEVQGYAYDALLAAADLLERPDLVDRAAQLQSRLVHDFWLEEEGTFAVAALQLPDGKLQLSTVIGSNPGHLLRSGILDGAALVDKRRRTIQRLLRPDMLAAAGVRTRSTTVPRFSPGAYHNGSTWPFDTGLLADGLRRHGFVRAAVDLEARIVRACQATGGFPEFLRGELDDSLQVNQHIVDGIEPDGRPNRLEQPPQQIQGWTVTRLWRILLHR